MRAPRLASKLTRALPALEGFGDTLKHHQTSFCLSLSTERKLQLAYRTHFPRVRSWSVKPLGWCYRTLLKEPSGMVQIPDREIAVRALPTKDKHLRDWKWSIAPT